MLHRLAWRSLCDRKAGVTLTVLAVALSVAIVVAVEHIRAEARDSFTRTVSGVDLIVGARTSQLNLLLYSVFRIGNASNNVSWESYQEIAASPQVAWHIPLSLGDSHRGYRVLGTSGDYFTHFRYGNRNALSFREGAGFDGVFDAVLGAEVADRLGYELGQEIVLAHGLGSVSFSNHDDLPFRVTGILAPTGTPVDQTVHISLQGMEAIHLGWQNGVRVPGQGIDPEDERLQTLVPSDITAVLLGLESRMAVFGLQRAINEYGAEALSAILPGVALAELWEMMSMVENLLGLISVLVLLASLLGLSTMLLASMRERQREIALYRTIGAHASSILFLIEIEALVITALGILLGFAMVALGLWFAQDWLSQSYGLVVSSLPLNPRIAGFMLVVMLAAALLALVPALAAYRHSLSLRLKG